MQLKALRNAGLGSLALLLLCACTVVDLDSSGNPIIPTDPSAEPNFTNQTPAQIAQGLWASKILPAAHTQALDWTALKQAQSGLKEAQTQSVYARISGKITGLDTEGLQRKLTVTVNGESVVMQLGPIIKGNAVRDAAGFIHFDDYKNQVQFAQVAKALNKEALSSLPALDASWVGQSVDVLAAFTLSPNSVDDGVPMEIKRGATQ
ncbi:DUF2291 family protein [Acerihabitans sp. TG2]|uniref:DUF2291 family protein n=1 Tax=Acerihabitans sp. TG2 TaxID=3096008 RepID=UPI002B231091|nr:DUF2291 family protein [Acerihabitans sp. TG2]MEA9389418.1 DUF2291 family protein [Acerihabitans sp. TG2]